MRYYDVPELDTEYPSVTTICDILDKSNALIPWAVGCTVKYLARHKDELIGNITEDRIKEILVESKRAYKEVSEEALDIGSAVHELIHLWLKGHKVQLTKTTEKPFNAFVEWAVENDIEIIDTEKILYNHKEKYAGTRDLKAWKKKKKYTIDFKTSKGFYEPSMPLQVAAYGKCDDSEGIGVLRLDKETGIPYWRDYTEDFDFYYDSFLLLKNFFYRHYAKKALRVQEGVRK